MLGLQVRQGQECLLNSHDVNHTTIQMLSRHTQQAMGLPTACLRMALGGASMVAVLASAAVA